MKKKLPTPWEFCRKNPKISLLNVVTLIFVVACILFFQVLEKQLAGMCTILCLIFELWSVMKIADTYTPKNKDDFYRFRRCYLIGTLVDMMLLVGVIMMLSYLHQCSIKLSFMLMCCSGIICVAALLNADMILRKKI